MRLMRAIVFARRASAMSRSDAGYTTKAGQAGLAKPREAVWMVVSRQACGYLAVADVVLFLIASAFNDHSSTSVDGIVWWLPFSCSCC